MLSFLSLIPLPVRLGLAGAAAGAIFAGGWTVQGWYDAGKLDAEKAAHQADVTSLKNQWQAKLDLEHAAYQQSLADRQTEREVSAKQRQEAERAHQIETDRLRAVAVRNAADSQRVRDDLAAAIAAGRVTGGGSCPVQQAGAGASCSGTSGGAICGLLSRALDLAARCADSLGQQHAAVVEAVSEWPK